MKRKITSNIIKGLTLCLLSAAMILSNPCSRIRANADNSSAAASDIEEGEPIKPELVNAVNTPEGVKLTWDPSYLSEGYNIYRQENDSGNWESLASVTGTSNTTYFDKTAKPGVKYTYTVKAYKKTLSSADSDGVSVVSLNTPELIDVSRSLIGITVTWNSVPNADGYAVYRKNENEKWEKITTLADPDATKYTDKKGSRFAAYTVKAYKGDNFSGAEEGIQSATRFTTTVIEIVNIVLYLFIAILFGTAIFKDVKKKRAEGAA